jgi:hypothetical protein
VAENLTPESPDDAVQGDAHGTVWQLLNGVEIVCHGVIVGAMGRMVSAAASVLLPWRPAPRARPCRRA